MKLSKTKNSQWLLKKKPDEGKTVLLSLFCLVCFHFLFFYYSWRSAKIHQTRCHGLGPRLRSCCSCSRWTDSLGRHQLLRDRQRRSDPHAKRSGHHHPEDGKRYRQAVQLRQGVEGLALPGLHSSAARAADHCGQASLCLDSGSHDGPQGHATG